MTAASEVTREMALYVSEAFYAYEAVRDARDEALARCTELQDQRDRARDVAAALEQTSHALLRVARRFSETSMEPGCPEQRPRDGDGLRVQCSFPAGHEPPCVFFGIVP